MFFRYCQNRLISLDIKKNPFLYEDEHGYCVKWDKQFKVQIIYTEDLFLKEEYSIQVIKEDQGQCGSYKGFYAEENCQHCDIKKIDSSSVSDTLVKKKNEENQKTPTKNSAPSQMSTPSTSLIKNDLSSKLTLKTPEKQESHDVPHHTQEKISKMDSTLDGLDLKDPQENARATDPNEKKPYHAVANGRVCGVFKAYKEYQCEVDGYPDAKYESFDYEDEAYDFISSIKGSEFVKRLKLREEMSIEKIREKCYQEQKKES